MLFYKRNVYFVWYQNDEILVKRKNMKLKIGDKAPEFKGITNDDKSVSLQDFKGRGLILFFYPKDSTPGCTAEACSLRDGYDDLRKKGYEILGVSADSVKRHQNFINKNNLPFPLLADEDKKVINDYGVWGEKKFMGRVFDGILRTTFVIDSDGVITHIIDKVKTKNHTEQIINLLEN